ncbi:isochorismate synthase MenF [Bacillus sp. CGMCC 1.16607]|uniref:isochorismate synthase n=1 Tax=Bacillus sp. CGMCC 1.16607 TaxID=3351842 RepID=UPI003643C729
MVTIQETELIEGIRSALIRSKNLNKPILVSEVHKIDKINPLSFFYAGKELFHGERFFWKDPSDMSIIVGLGICKQIQSDQSKDRFFHVEKEWKTFIQDGIVHATHSVHGVGPTMFGGFSFDPLKPNTDLWSKYPHTLFHLPKYMLSIIEGQTYLTTNILCTKNDDESLAMKVNNERTKLLKQLTEPFFEKENNPYNIEEMNPDGWKESVKNAVADLQKGTLKKVVLARELRLIFNQVIEVESVLHHLLNEQKKSFVFAFESNGDCFIGASPERLVKKEDKVLFSTCLAGSTARGKSVEEDDRLGNNLLSDSKNLIEHQYVVDMIRKAMEDFCIELTIPNEPVLMKMKDIQHLYTPVTGISKENTSLLQIVEHLHPTPALGGMPKLQAIEKIREIEEMDRGFYAGPIGWLDTNGNGEFAVAIRSGLIQGKEASLFAGCGIVEDSNADSEYEETNIKFRPMLNALGGKNK